MTIIIVAILACLVTGFVSFKAGVNHRKKVAEAQFVSAEEKAKTIVAEAEKSAIAKKREITLEAKEEIQKARAEFEKELKERRGEISRQERRIAQKEETLDKKTDNLERKEQSLAAKVKNLEARELEIAQIKEKEIAELEKISGLTQEEAKDIIIRGIESQARHDAAIMVKEIEQEAKENA